MKIYTSPITYIGYDAIRTTWYMGHEGAINDCAFSDIEVWIKAMYVQLGFNEEPVFFQRALYGEVYKILCNINLFFSCDNHESCHFDIVNERLRPNGLRMLSFKVLGGDLMWYAHARGSELFLSHSVFNSSDIDVLETFVDNFSHAWGWRATHMKWFIFLMNNTTFIHDADTTVLSTVINTPVSESIREFYISNNTQSDIPIHTIIRQCYDNLQSLSEVPLWN